MRVNPVILLTVVASVNSFTPRVARSPIKSWTISALRHSGPIVTRRRDDVALLAGDNADEKRAEYIAGTGLEGSGPLGVVNKFVPLGFRIALYGLFGISSIAGVAIAGSQNRPGDIGVNAIGLVAVAGVAFLDLKSMNDQVDKAKEMMANDSLGKDLWSESSGPATPGASPAGGDDAADAPPEAGKIMSAADLFGSESEEETTK